MHLTLDQIPGFGVVRYAKRPELYTTWNMSRLFNFQYGKSWAPMDLFLEYVAK